MTCDRDKGGGDFYQGLPNVEVPPADSEAGREVEHEALMVRWYPKSPNSQEQEKEKSKTEEKPEATENKVGIQGTLNEELRLRRLKRT